VCLTLERGLTGIIPPEIGDLSEITYIKIVENSIKGSLPVELGKLTNLKVLSFSDNEIEGSIPASLGNLINLEALYLSRNQLKGCYEEELSVLCDQLQQYGISSDNYFTASWEDFCESGLGTCISVPTNYSGDVNITASFLENEVPILKNNYIEVKDFTTCDQKNLENCELIKGFNDLAANEVFWAIEKAGNYFKNDFGITLPPLISLVNGNYKDNPNFAVFRKDTLIYGSGDNIERTTLTAPDIVGHEYMHYVIDFNNKLRSTNESGALGESFADIFGEILEYQCYGYNDWIFGGQVMINKSGIRSLSNPNRRK